MLTLQKLLTIRNGPGAAILPPDVTRIHMEFAMRMNDGHMGPRKFWRDNLPRLKFWNPAVPMIVNRVKDQSGPATMSIYIRDADADADADANTDVPLSTPTPNSSTTGHSTAPPPAKGERVEVISMKDMHSDTILASLISKTKAVPVLPTPQEQIQMEELENLRQQADVDRARVWKRVEAAKKEAAMMAAARDEAASLKAAM
ncbi:CI-B8 domain-containing protein [Lasiosphaeria miniovina]|uniref:CI-B8 domain-containing protein n=1 Tax=Lasiosphaeria miniovina TaxID=1954250 RepID=A0AA40DN17_9PEZI|nr:CI-B8 domain-containing protein [Lasiosphaeria miniovina]KAK0706867.1 CI-B8 domain-containing protein [Lasiosphaeria miniovina]